MDTPITRHARFTLSCIAALASAGALAQEPNPYYIGASQSLAHESNLFRRDGTTLPVVSDTLSVTSLLAGLDQPIGRQRLFADLSLRAGRFSNNKDLNYTGGGLQAGMDWEAADSLSGRLSYTLDRTLAPTGFDLGGPADAKNLQTTQEFVFRGSSSKVAPLAVEAGFVHRALDYSLADAEVEALEFKQNTGNVGLLYRPGGALTLGIGVRRTEGSYPFGVPGTPVPPATEPAPGSGTPDDFTRNDVDLSAVWTPTGASTLTARLSRTREKHELRPTRDVSGNTGAISWNFKPTGKVSLTTDYIRDTGAESTFIGGAPAGATTQVVNSSPRATTVQLRGDYELTAKVQVQAFVRRLKRELVNNATPVPGTGEDTTSELRIGANWAPLRSVLVGCSIGREERDASVGATANQLSAPYSANTFRCLAQFRTQ